MSLQEKRHWRSLSFFAVCGHREKIVLCKQGKEVSPETEFFQHLDLGLLAFQNYEEKNEFLLFKPCGLWYFIMAAGEN